MLVGCCNAAIHCCSISSGYDIMSVIVAEMKKILGVYFGICGFDIIYLFTSQCQIFAIAKDAINNI